MSLQLLKHSQKYYQFMLLKPSTYWNLLYFYGCFCRIVYLICEIPAAPLMSWAFVVEIWEAWIFRRINFIHLKENFDENGKRNEQSEAHFTSPSLAKFNFSWRRRTFEATASNAAQSFASYQDSYFALVYDLFIYLIFELFLIWYPLLLAIVWLM